MGLYPSLYVQLNPLQRISEDLQILSVMSGFLLLSTWKIKRNDMRVIGRLLCPPLFVHRPLQTDSCPLRPHVSPSSPLNYHFPPIPVFDPWFSQFLAQYHWKSALNNPFQLQNQCSSHVKWLNLSQPFCPQNEPFKPFNAPILPLTDPFNPKLAKFWLKIIGNQR